MSKLQHTKEELIKELNQLRKRNEELEYKLKEKQLTFSDYKQFNTLKESQMLYKTLLENTDIGFEIIEPLYDEADKIYDYRWLEVNNAWKKQVGIKAVSVVGKRATDIFSNVEDYWLEKYDSVIKTGKSERYEIYGEETRRWFSCHCFPYDKDRLCILFRDISEKKQVEIALRESEQLYRTLFENTEDAFHIAELICDDDGKPSDYKFLKLNKTWEKQTGLNAIDVLGKRVRQVVPNIEPYWIEMYDKIMKLNKSVRYENYNVSTNKWYSMVGFPYAKGQIGILFRDITTSKINQRKLAIQADILSNVFDAVIVADENNVITYSNKALTNLFGWKEHEIIGKPIAHFRNEYLDADSKVKLEKLLLERVNIQEGFQIKELSCKCKNGKKIIIDLNISMLKGLNGDFKGNIISIKDVSQRVEYLKKLIQSERNSKELIEKLHKADENMIEFLNKLSHEIRNPMAAAMLSLSLINSVEPNSVQAIKAEETLNRQLKHLSGLIDDLLDVTRIKTNKVKLNKEILEVNELIRNAVMDHMSLYEKKEVALEFEPSSSPLYIDADNIRINQVLDNLLINAVKFTNSGDSTTLKVQRDDKKSEVVLTIKDTGKGISPEHLSELFNPFMQVDNSLDRSNGGLGLGLAIVKGIVELHGGNVTVFSEGIGKGTNFTIRLPLVNDSAEKKGNFSSKEKKSSKTLGIIVIDDNEDLTLILCDLIRYLGHIAVAVTNGKDGILKAKEHHSDVIICDIGLPFMNGYEVAKSIRNDNDLKGLFLIALSGYAQQEDVERARQAGFDMHLAKPISLDTLKTTLEYISSN